MVTEPVKINSVKLTGTMRGHIRQELLKIRNTKERSATLDKIFAESGKLATMTYERFLGPDLRKIKSMPEGWMPSLDYVLLTAGKSKINKLHFNGYSRFLPQRETPPPGTPRVMDLRRPYRQMDLYNHRHLEVNDDDPLYVMLLDIQKRAVAIAAEEERLKTEISSVLYSVTSTGHLISIWPELTPIVRRLYGTSKQISTVPAKVLNDLNSVLGLKVA